MYAVYLGYFHQPARPEILVRANLYKQYLDID